MKNHQIRDQLVCIPLGIGHTFESERESGREIPSIPSPTRIYRILIPPKKPFDGITADGILQYPRIWNDGIGSVNVIAVQRFMVGADDHKELEIA